MLLLLGVGLIRRPKTRLTKLCFWLATLLLISLNGFRLFFYVKTCELSREKFHTVSTLLFYLLIITIKLWLHTKGELAASLIARITSYITIEQRKTLTSKIAKPLLLYFFFIYTVNLFEMMINLYAIGTDRYCRMWFSDDCDNLSNGSKPIINHFMTLVYFAHSAAWYDYIACIYLFVNCVVQITSCKYLELMKSRVNVLNGEAALRHL